MIIIPVFFGGGSTVEEHDIAHIASSIFSPLDAGFFFAVPTHMTLPGKDGRMNQLTQRHSGKRLLENSYLTCVAFYFLGVSFENYRS
nr:hypothetical protein [Erwinia sp. Ejp617]